MRVIVSRVRRALIIIMLLPICCVADESAESNTKVTVSVAHSEIRRYDPLFINVVVQNRSTFPIVFDRELSAHEGTLLFEVAFIAQNKFSSFAVVAASLQGCPRGIAVQKTRFIPGKGCRESSELLFLSANGFIFDRPGQYGLRARIVNNPGITGVSDLVTIRVQDCPLADVQLLSGNRNLLARAVMSGAIGIDVTRDDVAQIRNALSNGLVSSTLDQIDAVLAVRDANSLRELEESLTHTNAVRSKADPVTQDAITTSLANILFSKHNDERAREELLRLRSGHYFRTRLLKSIRARSPE